MLWQKKDIIWLIGHLDIFLKYRAKCSKNSSCFELTIRSPRSLVREHLESGHLVCHKSPAMTDYTIPNKFFPSTEQFLSDYYVTNILDDGDIEVLNIYYIMFKYIKYNIKYTHIFFHVFLELRVESGDSDGLESLPFTEGIRADQISQPPHNFILASET